MASEGLARRRPELVRQARGFGFLDEARGGGVGGEELQDFAGDADGIARLPKPRPGLDRLHAG